MCRPYEGFLREEGRDGEGVVVERVGRRFGVRADKGRQPPSNLWICAPPSLPAHPHASSRLVHCFSSDHLDGSRSVCIGLLRRQMRSRQARTRWIRCPSRASRTSGESVDARLANLRGGMDGGMPKPWWYGWWHALPPRNVIFLTRECSDEMVERISNMTLGDAISAYRDLVNW